MTSVIFASCEAHALPVSLATGNWQPWRHGARRNPIAAHAIARRIAARLPCSTAMLMRGRRSRLGAAKPAKRSRIHLAVRPI
ncbi:hypothetical protein IEQ11_16860 [Lysobacter capsici]|uniref:hypothetical protein n=1 Tax=Lysobacter capsici TaxID=435897 RepID=UPI0017856A41|nr:hypothetical protein [Lysobacter capsici]UOF13410.1 hypothetical protein IEQ11_16860 [Lysobacter capsici]WND78938.1 hypothetical protein RJ610_16715 [Lysobacter capsici]WND84133.1 hypothetical protein RJ609_16725 [Lysobacter capsici]